MSAEEVPRENDSTISSVARKVGERKGPRPEQGARVLALRQAAGLTQIELAQALGVPHSNIAYWEWSDKPPRADLLPRLAQIFGVDIEAIVGEIPRAARTKHKTSAPIGELQRTFDAVRKLPRKQQRKIIEMVTALVDQYNRKSA